MQFLLMHCTFFLSCLFAMQRNIALAHAFLSHDSPGIPEHNDGTLCIFQDQSAELHFHLLFPDRLLPHTGKDSYTPGTLCILILHISELS